MPRHEKMDEVHRSIQRYLKKCGEGWGYKCSIEKALSNGGSSVDVIMEKEHVRIACKIFVTAVIDDLQNLRNCLDADFSYIVMICLNDKILKSLRATAQKEIENLDVDKVKFIKQDDMVSFLYEIAAKTASIEKTVMGYKVKLNYKTMNKNELAVRMDSICKIMVEASRREQRKVNNLDEPN